MACEGQNCPTGLSFRWSDSSDENACWSMVLKDLSGLLVLDFPETPDGLHLEQPGEAWGGTQSRTTLRQSLCDVLGIRSCSAACEDHAIADDRQYRA